MSWVRIRGGLQGLRLEFEDRRPGASARRIRFGTSYHVHRWNSGKKMTVVQRPSITGSEWSQ